MSKFNVGDKVRRQEDHRNGSWEEACEGNDELMSCICTVTRSGSCFEVEDLSGNKLQREDCIWTDDWFDLVEENPEEPEYKPKVGDRIEMIKNYSYARTGMKGTIRKVADGCGSPSVEFDENFSGGHTCNGLIKNCRGHFVSIKNMKPIMLIDNKMEIEEIKKIDKPILAEANAEVLKEIQEEQKEQAKKVLRGLYNRKDEADKKSAKVNTELKDIMGEIATLTKK